MRARLTLLLLAVAACDLVLGLTPPSGEPSVDGSMVEAGPSVCAALDGGAVSYSSLALSSGNWEFFDTNTISAISPHSFAGGTFDGHYVYFAGRGNNIVRFDTTNPAGFGQVVSWTTTKTPSGSTGFIGAVYDGRYVYLVPFEDSSVYYSLVTRYDTTLAFDAGTAWTVFDTSTLPGGADGGLSGFSGGTFDGRYVYLAPHASASGHATSRVVRYDTFQPDAGPTDAGADADAAAAPVGFVNPADWASFDLTSVDPTALGYYGAVFDGTYVYLAPFQNFLDNGIVRVGESATVARYHVAAAQGFASDPSWATFDVTGVNGQAFGFAGAGFDGRYVYFAPDGNGVVARFDSTGAFASLSSWSAFDLSELVPTTDAGVAAHFQGVAFDGRFVYFIPSEVGYPTLVRYDTASTFTAACAWSSVDLSQASLDGATPDNYVGAVFDGQYLYLIPNTNGIAARFNARTPSLTPLPSHGSFL